ncbi:MAG: DedA family protein [Acidobacteria bacterium]|nr:DedA family protein [Acidobacteriota bacterium]
MASEVSGRSFDPFRWLRKLYDWVVSLSERPNAALSLFVLAFAEASFFPIPPDILLIGLAIGAPRRALWFATICTLGSALGALLGYLLGLQFYELIGQQLVEFYAAGEQYQRVQALYQEWDVLAIAVAGFTPIPFKVFTISEGVFELNLLTFGVAVVLSRGARFFLLGVLIWRFGSGIREFVDRYFNLLTILFIILLVGGFLIVQYIV